MKQWSGWLKILGLAVLSGLASGWSVTALLAGDPAATGSVTREQALQVFERLKSQAGEWEGRSTAGWEGTARHVVMARGSVVLVTSKFKDAAHDGMATAMHLDGDRLLLTHYCEARNQPRLVLSRVEDGGRTAVFTFLDATNMASRDSGHMDKVVIRFQDDDHYTSQWTWYQDGQERWLEEITHTRIHAQSQR
jgi:hypothetical protein